MIILPILLTLNNDNCCGYDATGNSDRAGQRILIKSRIIGDCVKSDHRLGQMNPNGSWELIIVSLLDHDFEPLEMYQLYYEDAIEALTGSGKKINTISIAKFRIISDFVWTRENGIERNVQYQDLEMPKRIRK